MTTEGYHALHAEHGMFADVDLVLVFSDADRQDPAFEANRGLWLNLRSSTFAGQPFRSALPASADAGKDCMYLHLPLSPACLGKQVQLSAELHAALATHFAKQEEFIEERQTETRSRTAPEGADFIPSDAL